MTERGGGRGGQGMTSSWILQIVNKDCLARAEDCSVTDLDSETEAN
jgi:hypothetical protein